jgi:Tfp pilus assembly protein PilX
LFHRVVSDSESLFEKKSVSENESFINFVNNNIHLLDEQSASVNLSNDVSVTATAINIQPSFVSETVLDSLTVPAMSEQSASVNLSNDVSVTATAINIQPSFVSETVLDSLTVPAMSESKERGKALKSDFKLMYADFHIAGYLL